MPARIYKPARTATQSGTALQDSINLTSLGWLEAYASAYADALATPDDKLHITILKLKKLYFEELKEMGLSTNNRDYTKPEVFIEKIPILKKWNEVVYL